MSARRSAAEKLRLVRTTIELAEGLDFVLIEHAGPAVLGAVKDALARICHESGRPFREAGAAPLLEWLTGEQIASAKKPHDRRLPAVYFAPVPEQDEGFVLARLNENRDNLGRDLRGVLCLVGGVDFLQRVASAAPSIWSMRSGVFTFDSPILAEEETPLDDVFLAAALHDEDAAAELTRRLESDGVRVSFLPESKMDVRSGPGAILEAAQKARFTVPLFSPDFQGSSTWRALESGRELREEPEKLRSRMLPVLLKPGGWPAFFEGFRPFDFTTPDLRDREYPQLLSAIRGDPVGTFEAPSIDVLILTALEDELNALLAEGGRTAVSFRKVRDRNGLPYYVGTTKNERGQRLGVAASWTGAMGSTAAAARASALLQELEPDCVAMCGICAGKRGDVFLGDVIVADRVYAFDQGKLKASDEGQEPTFFHDITTYNLERAWQMDATAFARDTGWQKDLSTLRPASRAVQATWILQKLYDHEQEGAPHPLSLPERGVLFRVGDTHARDWADRLRELREQGFVTIRALATGKGDKKTRVGAAKSTAAELRLTVRGRKQVEEERLLYPEGPPQDPELRVHVGAIASGNAVVEDPEVFDRLKRVGRKTIGLEMEGAAIGHVGELLPRRAIVVKGVSDYADGEKDDRYRHFAARASAAWLLSFLRKHLSSKAAEAAVGVAETKHGAQEQRIEALESRRERRELDSLAGRGRARFPSRVEQVIRLREPDAVLEWKDAESPPVHAFLEVRRREGQYFVEHPVGIVEGAVSSDWLEAFAAGVVKRYREVDPGAPAWLVHSSAATDVLQTRARRLGIRLWSFTELQGLLDFRNYVAQQTARLQRDPFYPSSLFVPQRLTYRLGREEIVVQDALETLQSWLSLEGPQLSLILGDFGTGKTFLMHELAIRLGDSGSDVTPVLIELRKLDKARSLEELLGQHFVPERGMPRFDHGAFRYMLEQGKIALLFDGFDELVARVTYERASEHLSTVLEAATGSAKIVLTSRTQHFLTDHDVLKPMGERARERGFRLMKLGSFDEARVLDFLTRRLQSETKARARYDLLCDVKDLAGLAANPRMLGFIADLSDEELVLARASASKKPEKKLSSADLYEMLIGRWLTHEVERRHPLGVPKGLDVSQRRMAVSEIARMAWVNKDSIVRMEEIPAASVDAVLSLAAVEIDRDEAVHEIGSGTLLCRDENGNFRFLHRSVMEYLVARQAAEKLKDTGAPSLLEAGEISDLMADFFAATAGRERAVEWAHGVLESEAGDILTRNATRVLQRLDEKLRRPLVRPGHDLRGQDFSGQDLANADLSGADLSEALLASADLSGANLSGAKLVRANLERANLRDADLTGADLRSANLVGADLTGARLEKASLRYAKLVNALVNVEGLDAASTFGAAPSRPARAEPTTLGGSVAGFSAALAISPDGALLAVGDRTGTIRLWDLDSRRALFAWPAHWGQVTSLVFSPDGCLLASGSEDASIGLWDVGSKKQVASLQGHSGRVNSMAFSPDGRQLASSSTDSSIRFWDVGHPKIFVSLQGDFGLVHSVAFSSDGRLLALGSDDRSVELWDVSSRKRIALLQGHSMSVHSVAFSPKGRLLASGSDDDSVKLWEVGSKKPIASLRGHSERVNSVAFSPDGRLLASGSHDRSVKLWDVGSKKQIASFQGHSISVHSVAFFAKGQLLASGSVDRSVKLWDVGSKKQVASLQGHSDSVHSVAFSCDGLLFASGSTDSTIGLWDVGSKKQVASLQGHSDLIRSVMFSPDGRLLASGSADKSVGLWDVCTKKQVAALQGHSESVFSVAFSPEGRLLASGSADNSIILWDVDAKKQIASLKGHSNLVKSVIFSPDGRLLASGSFDRSVGLWDVGSKKQVASLGGYSSWVSSVAFSPDGQLLASGSFDRSVGLWDVGSQKRVAALQEHSDSVSSVAFSPDGRLLASGSDDNSVRLWDAGSKKRVAVLQGHSGSVLSVAFSPDGRLLVSASQDGTLRFWSIATAACVMVLVSAEQGWAAFSPDGRYKFHGDIPGCFWHVVGLCRFEPGELDGCLDAFTEHKPLRLAEDDPFE